MIEQEGEPLWAEFAREILRWLRSTGLQTNKVEYAGYLTAYCLYWWSAFARGYLFEVSIFRDLTQSGIVFHPHDPRSLSERYGHHDLEIGAWKGDVKLSFYFVSEAKGLPLDFYLTRMYDRVHQEHLKVVLMTASTWQFIDGETLPGTLAAALSVLPHPVQLELSKKAWVLSRYEDWKEKILTWQGVIR